MKQTGGRGRDLPYRPCVGLVLLNGEGKVFVGRRKQEAGSEFGERKHAWQMPQGGIDPGEAPYAAALRELHEETNVSSVDFLAEAPEWLSYDLPGALNRKSWRGRYRGQTQKWFAFRFTGDEREIDIRRPAGGRHKAEFDDWRWEDIERLPDLIIPFKRSVYEQVVAVFAPYAVAAKPPAETSR